MFSRRAGSSSDKSPDNRRKKVFPHRLAGRAGVDDLLKGFVHPREVPRALVGQGHGDQAERAERNGKNHPGDGDEVERLETVIVFML
jgi:hypothetical protein